MGSEDGWMGGDGGISGWVGGGEGVRWLRDQWMGGELVSGLDRISGCG